LIDWAKQGVLLLNTVLTVEAGKANSHRKKGWEMFTDKVIQLLNDRNDSVIFLLWGKNAQEKTKMITNKHHYILEAPHPSPLSARKGFFGCKHFSKTNSILIDLDKKVIDWQIKNI